MQAGSTAGYLIACPYGTWTQAVGASTIEQCLTPPGHYTNITAKTTTLCPAHSYRANWLPYEQAEAQACTACGVGVLAAKTDRVTWSFPNGTDVEVAVTSSPDDCCEWLNSELTAPACACNHLLLTAACFWDAALHCRDSTT
jgi:ferredoxin-like protein FixX